MNIRRLRMVQRRILKYPEQFRMSHWFNMSYDIGSPVFQENSDFDFRENKGCKTAACIGGWVAHVAKINLNDQPIERIAKALDITDEQTRRLTLLSYMGGRHWPLKFENLYYVADTPAAKAQVASDRIDHFIKTKGKE